MNLTELHEALRVLTDLFPDVKWDTDDNDFVVFHTYMEIDYDG